MSSKGFALTWYRALTCPRLFILFPWYSLPARPFTAPDDPLLVTGQQGSPSPACRQLFRAENACAESSSEEIKYQVRAWYQVRANPLLASSCVWFTSRNYSSTPQGLQLVSFPCQWGNNAPAPGRVHGHSYFITGSTNCTPNSFICNDFTTVGYTDNARASQPSAPPSTDGARLSRARRLLSLSPPSPPITQQTAAERPAAPTQSAGPASTGLRRTATEDQGRVRNNGTGLPRYDPAHNGWVRGPGVNPRSSNSKYVCVCVNRAGA